MNLKKDYIAKVIGKETIISDGTPFKCWEISQNGGDISEQLFWVTGKWYLATHVVGWTQTDRSAND